MLLIWHSFTNDFQLTVLIMCLPHILLSALGLMTHPKISLVLLFLATQFLDMLWLNLLLLGLEHVSIKPGVTQVTPLFPGAVGVRGQN
jgi:hypothetical protein